MENPSAYVKKAARQAGVSVKTAEARWAACEAAARKKRPKPRNFYAYVMGCFQQRMGLRNPVRLQPEILHGGEADHVPDSAFDRIALIRGTQHEMEHTANRAIAKEIAKDHLLEDPRYYERLERMERKRNSAPPKQSWYPSQRRIKREEQRQRRRSRADRLTVEHVEDVRHRHAIDRRHERNPGEPSPKSVERYERFHGVEPQTYQAGQWWVPGDLTLLGECIEVNYQIIDPDSEKDLNQVYFHDHGPRVKVYKRCERGDPVDLSYHSFPEDLVVLGSFPGLIVIDEDGNETEIKGSKKKLVATPDKHRLVILDNRGVLYLIKGGKLKIEDWIYN